LNTEDFVEKRYYPAWQDFTVVGNEYYLTLDQNATSNFTIDNLNRVATDILDFSVINPTNRNLMYKSGSLLNINSNVVRVLSFDYMTGKVTLNFTPKNTFRINYLCQYANNEVPIGKKLEVENTEITVQNSGVASEIAYNNSTSALTSTDVQSAIDELVRTAKATSHEDLSNIQQVGTGITNGHISDSTQTIEGTKTFSSNIVGSITGNSGTATKLATARTIGGVSFDGTANINLPGVNAAGNQNTTGNAGSATKLATARTINGVAFDGSANITVSDDTKLTKTNPSIIGSITEQVYNLTGTVINPANGTIQYKTVSSNTTFTETLISGQSVLLRLINATSYTITFPTITWVGADAPILTANCAIALWKEQSTLYGAYIGTLVW